MATKVQIAMLALVVPTGITLCGVWAFMANIHDNSVALKALEIVALPVASLASLASLAGFFHSNAVYWATIAVGFVLWAMVVYVAAMKVTRRRGVP